MKEFIFPQIGKGEEPYSAMVQGIMINDDQMKSDLEKLDGLGITDYIQVMTCDTTIEFEYKGYSFSTDNAYMVWTFVVDADCRADIISEIINHLNSIKRD